MKFQILFTLAALGSGTLAFPAVPSYTSEDGTDVVPKSTKVRHHPTGVFMSGGYPTGDFPTGYPKHTGAHGTGHHKSVHPTDAPILPRHRPHPTGGYPGVPGSIPPMPSNDPLFSSFRSDHFSGPHPTESFTMDPFPTGGPAGKRDVPAPYPSDASSDVQTSDAAFTGKGPHKTGAHGTGAHPEPTGIVPTGAGKPEGYPKYSKQY